MSRKLKSAAVFSALCIVLAMPANAITVGAVGATVDAGGPGYGSIDATFDQSGLSQGYTSGVTDFDSYVSSVTHSYCYKTTNVCDEEKEQGQQLEWFGNGGGDPGSAEDITVTYDLGVSRWIDKMALWNEDYSGIGTLRILASNSLVDGFIELLSTNPQNNPSYQDYGAEVFGFGGPQFFRYFQLQGTDCPQTFDGEDSHNPFYACAIGEVAFNEVAPVPLPGAGLLLIGALGGLGIAGRRLRKRKPLV